MSFIRDLFRGSQPKRQARATRREPRLGLRLPRGDVRSFQGAGTQTLLSNWTGATGTPNGIARAELNRLKARVRDQYYNNDHAKQFVRLLKTNVVGPVGFTMQGRVINGDGAPDVEANKALETAWRSWCKPGACSVEGRHSLIDLENLTMTALATDGEALFRKWRGTGSGAFAFQIEQVDSRRLDPLLNKDLPGGGQICLGIEYDPAGRRAAYWLRKGLGAAYYGARSDQYERVPAEDVIHLYLPELVGQERGFPWMATPLVRMHMLSGYEDAAVVAARAGASKMGFYEIEGGDEYDGDDKTADDVPISDFEAGQIEVLPEGWKFSPHDPTYPSDQYAVFVKAALRGISSGLGVSYHNLANDLEGVNYSSGRLGELADREVWKSLQGWLIEHFLEPVYQEWLELALLAGQIQISGRPMPVSRLQRFSAVEFRGRRWQWVDPQKEANAYEKLIDLGVMTRSEVIRDRGREPEEVWQEAAAERKQMSDLGIPITTQAKEAATDAKSSEETDAE